MPKTWEIIRCSNKKTKMQCIAACLGMLFTFVFAADLYATPYTITATAGSGGSISPAGAVVVNSGGNQTFDIAPNMGYHIVDVIGCGGTLTGNTYTTGTITADCTVAASFEINTYVLGLTTSGTGSGVVTSNEAGISCGTDCEEIYTYGTVVTLAVVPASGAMFAGWGGDGGCVGTESCTVTITDNLSVTAAFTSPHMQFSAVSAARIHTAAIGNNGTLWTWGGNWYGELGDGTTTDRYLPVRIGSDTNWSTVSTGDFHTAAIKTDGTLWAWGENSSGQLGDGTTGDKWTPVQVGSDTGWIAVSAGGSHTIAIKANGTLWAWGNNWSGQLGDGTGEDKLTPVQVGTDTNWSAVYARDYHTLALKTDGTLWAWGDNSWGQLGDGTWYSKLSPVQIGSDTDWGKIAAGGWHTMALKTAGTLWGWGLIDDGPLSPIQIGSDTWNAVAAGYLYTATIKADGTLWQVGCSMFGILGDCTTSDIVAIGTDANWADITVGEDHVVATKTGGTLWAWGSNWYGQLGDGTATERYSPVPLFAPPASSATPESNNFGSYFVGQTSPPVIFTIGNSSLEPLVISGVSLSGADSSSFAILSDGCTGRALIKNSSCTVQVRFQPVLANAKTAALNVQSNDPANELREIPLSGSGVPLTISANAGEGGSISPTGAATVNYNASQTFIITPNTGYSIADVTVDGVSQGAITSYIFTSVTANHIITATFSINTYTITVTAESGGSISPSGGIAVNSGGNQTFAISPNSSFTISDVTVDGVSQGAISSYTFTNVTANHTIAATFVASSMTLTIDTPANGAAINRPDAMVTGTVTNAAGYETGVTVNGVVAIVYGNQFVANHVPLQEGANTITATATDINGTTATASVTVNAVTTGIYIRLTADTETGVSPLDATLRVDGTFNISASTLSATGPAQPEILFSSADQYKVRMTAEGIYYFTASVTGPDGNPYQDTVAVGVMNQNQMDVMFRGKWESMRSALAIGDINTAISFFEAGSQETYRTQFTTLQSLLGAISNEMGQINLVKIADARAEYEIITTRNGVTYSFYLLFVRDRNGLWKIKQF